MTIRDRLLDESDLTIQYLCAKCGHISMRMRRGNFKCPICEESADIHPVEMSYAFKLLLEELISLSIDPKIILEELV